MDDSQFNWQLTINNSSYNTPRICTVNTVLFDSCYNSSLFDSCYNSALFDSRYNSALFDSLVFSLQLSVQLSRNSFFLFFFFKWREPCALRRRALGSARFIPAKTSRMILQNVSGGVLELGKHHKPPLPPRWWQSTLFDGAKCGHTTSRSATRVEPRDRASPPWKSVLTTLSRTWGCIASVTWGVQGRSFFNTTL